MSLREKIFEEIRRLKYGNNAIWKVQEQMLFKNEILNPIEANNFSGMMLELQNEGIFSVDEYSVWRLTKKGEETIYSN